ncbi:MAG: hypothetical protein FJ096_00795 [Deltaproteobacteria bacterium]|nr:hypothetical protein [Deltaproteobacteria bacterium]
MAGLAARRRRERVTALGGFTPFACVLEDVTLATEDEAGFDERTLALARRAGVGPDGLAEWRLHCKTEDEAAGAVVIVHVPTHDLWADAALGPEITRVELTPCNVANFIYPPPERDGAVGVRLSRSASQEAIRVTMWSSATR